MKTKDDMPLDARDLARDLGISHKQLAAMIRKFGTISTLERLQRLWLKHIPDRSRLLAKDSSHGYTSSPHAALSKEPEAISVDEQNAITKEAHARAQIHAEQIHTLRRHMPLDQRLLETRAEAQRRGVAAGDVRALDRLLARERKGFGK